MAYPNDPNYYNYGQEQGQNGQSFGWNDAASQGDGFSFDMDAGNLGQEQ